MLHNWQQHGHQWLGSFFDFTILATTDVEVVVMNHQNILLESTRKSFKPPENNLIAWKVNLSFVYRELHNLNAIEQVSPSPLLYDCGNNRDLI